MPSDDITITLTQQDAGLVLYGCQAFVSLLTGQLTDAASALGALADDAGIVLLAEAVATFITAVSEQMHPAGTR